MIQNPVPSRTERLKVFLKRLDAEPAARTLEDAFELVCQTLNCVEDELSSIPYDLTKSASDGRLYPPVWEELTDVTGHPNVKRYRHRWHFTYFGANGSIEFVEVRSGNVFHAKPGFDGRGVWQ